MGSVSAKSIHSLKKIAKKYPSLSGPAYIAEKEFVATFGSSIEAMDELMSKHAKAEWDKIKSEGARQFTSTLDIELINEKQAREFVELVRQRAKGNIESPVLETLLLFESNYEAHPEREFLAGYKYSFSSAESTKTKGVHFTIEAPRTWAAKEGKRPNIVQKFVSENGRGPGFLVIQVKDLPLAPGEKVTARDVEEMLNPKGIRDFLPAWSDLHKQWSNYSREPARTLGSLQSRDVSGAKCGRNGDHHICGLLREEDDSDTGACGNGLQYQASRKWWLRKI